MTSLYSHYIVFWFYFTGLSNTNMRKNIYSLETGASLMVKLLFSSNRFCIKYWILSWTFQCMASAYNFLYLNKMSTDEFYDRPTHDFLNNLSIVVHVLNVLILWQFCVCKCRLPIPSSLEVILSLRMIFFCRINWYKWHFCLIYSFTLTSVLHRIFIYVQSSLPMHNSRIDWYINKIQIITSYTNFF